MILQQFTSYLLVCQTNNLIIYNTHLTHDWYINALVAEKQTDHQAHHHHHRGQNRPHQKTITHSQGSPPEPAEPDTKFLCGGEDLIGPPLPHLHGKNVPAVEQLLYGWGYQDKSTAKEKQI